MNLPGLLRASAHRSPEQTAVIYGPDSERSMSYSALDAEVDRVALGLLERGISRGDRVGIAMHNVIHFPVAYFGVLRAGAVAVPLNAMLTRGEVATVLQDSGAVAVLTAPPFSEVAVSAAHDAPEVKHVVSTEKWDELGAPGRPAPDPDVDEDDLAVLAYTSGTTGKPKGAMLTHGNLLANLNQQMAIPEAHVRSDDVLLLALPLFHIYGLNVTLGLLVMNAASGVLLERFEPLRCLELIREHKVTVVFGAPPMYAAWAAMPGGDRDAMSSVRLAVSGAAPLAPEVLERFRDGFGVEIYEGYGLTETAPTVTSNRMADTPRPGSIGKALPDVEVRLVDDAGRDVEPGDPGEIIVRGPNVFKGYWQQPEETARLMDEGWFRTGDIAVEDDDGYIYLVDRKRDLIIVSGFNVFPSEVESALVQNPKVLEAAVVGVPHSYSGEAVKAFVVLEPGESAGEDEIISDVRTRIARFKAPSGIEFVDELPHLLSGKVLRRALRT